MHTHRLLRRTLTHIRRNVVIQPHTSTSHKTRKKWQNGTAIDKCQIDVCIQIVEFDRIRVRVCDTVQCLQQIISNVCISSSSHYNTSSANQPYRIDKQWKYLLIINNAQYSANVQLITVSIEYNGKKYEQKTKKKRNWDIRTSWSVQFRSEFGSLKSSLKSSQKSKVISLDSFDRISFSTKTKKINFWWPSLLWVAAHLIFRMKITNWSNRFHISSESVN